MKKLLFYLLFFFLVQNIVGQKLGFGPQLGVGRYSDVYFRDAQLTIKYGRLQAEGGIRNYYTFPSDYSYITTLHKKSGPVGGLLLKLVSFPTKKQFSSDTSTKLKRFLTSKSNVELWVGLTKERLAYDYKINRGLGTPGSFYQYDYIASNVMMALEIKLYKGLVIITNVSFKANDSPTGGSVGLRAGYIF